MVQTEQLLHIPVDSAAQCLQLNFKDILKQEIVTEARFRNDSLPDYDIFDCHRIRVGVVTFSGAIAMAAHFHQTTGGMERVKSLLTQYVADSKIQLGGATLTSIAGGHEVQGLVRAIQNAWKAKNIN